MANVVVVVGLLTPPAPPSRLSGLQLLSGVLKLHKAAGVASAIDSPTSMWRSLMSSRALCCSYSQKCIYSSIVAAGAMCYLTLKLPQSESILFNFFLDFCAKIDKTWFWSKNILFKTLCYLILKLSQFLSWNQSILFKNYDALNPLDFCAKNYKMWY